MEGTFSGGAAALPRLPDPTEIAVGLATLGEVAIETERRAPADTAEPSPDSASWALPAAAMVSSAAPSVGEGAALDMEPALAEVVAPAAIAATESNAAVSLDAGPLAESTASLAVTATESDTTASLATETLVMPVVPAVAAVIDTDAAVAIDVEPLTEPIVSSVVSVGIDDATITLDAPTEPIAPTVVAAVVEAANVAGTQPEIAPEAIATADVTDASVTPDILAEPVASAVVAVAEATDTAGLSEPAASANLAISKVAGAPLAVAEMTPDMPEAVSVSTEVVAEPTVLDLSAAVLPPNLEVVASAAVVATVAESVAAEGEGPVEVPVSTS